MQHYGILNYGITAYGLITALRHYGIYGLRFLITVFTSRAVTVNGISTATIGQTKRITERVKELLTIMFHTGTANPRLKMNASEMHEELLKRVANGKITKDDVPKIPTIANWITNTSRSFKKTMVL